MISLEQIKRHFVWLKGNQVIDGIKRFAQFPFTPHAAPEENYHAVNKKYVDDADASISISNNLLDGNHHQDTTASAAVRGHIIAANATPEWDVISIGLAAEFLKSDGTDPAWASVAWGDISGAGAVSTWISSVSTSVSAEIGSVSSWVGSVSSSLSTNVESISTNTEWISSLSTSLSTNIESISTNTEYIASVSNYYSTYVGSVSTTVETNADNITSLSTWVASVSSSLGSGGGLDVNLSNVATSVSISASIFIENDLEITGDFVCESSSNIYVGSVSTTGTWYLSRASTDWIVYRISTSAAGGATPYEKWRFIP